VGEWQIELCGMKFSQANASGLAVAGKPQKVAHSQQQLWLHDLLKG
jgi:hypothetical protein